MCQYCWDPERRAWADKFLGKGWNPHSGFAALRRENAFYEWVAAGKDPAAFAAQFDSEKEGK